MVIILIGNICFVFSFCLLIVELCFFLFLTKFVSKDGQIFWNIFQIYHPDLTYPQFFSFNRPKNSTLNNKNHKKYNSHILLTIINVKIICGAIRDTLIEIEKESWERGRRDRRTLSLQDSPKSIAYLIDNSREKGKRKRES